MSVTVVSVVVDFGVSLPVSSGPQRVWAPERWNLAPCEERRKAEEEQRLEAERKAEEERREERRAEVLLPGCGQHDVRLHQLGKIKRNIMYKIPKIWQSGKEQASKDHVSWSPSGLAPPQCTPLAGCTQGGRSERTRSRSWGEPFCFSCCWMMGGCYTLMLSIVQKGMIIIHEHPWAGIYSYSPTSVMKGYERDDALYIGARDSFRPWARSMVFHMPFVADIPWNLLILVVTGDTNISHIYGLWILFLCHFHLIAILLYIIAIHLQSSPHQSPSISNSPSILSIHFPSTFHPLFIHSLGQKGPKCSKAKRKADEDIALVRSSSQDSKLSPGPMDWSCWMRLNEISKVFTYNDVY